MSDPGPTFPRLNRPVCAGLLVALMLAPAMAAAAVPLPRPRPLHLLSPAELTPQRRDRAIAAYHHRLAVWRHAHAAYEKKAEAYWHTVAVKRRARFAKHRRHEPVVARDYVLSQPPRYTGPPRPADPTEPPKPPSKRSELPVVADFLAAARAEFGFVPERPQSERHYKAAYAATAAAAGLTRSQIVRVYGFEASGDGRYDVQAGLEVSGRGHAISTALGYNQLLSTNSVELVAEKGDRFVAALRARAAALPPGQRQALEHKITILQRMIAFARTVPDRWHHHARLARTDKGLAVHALNLDIDIGPLLQTQKLLDSVVYAKRRGLDRTLTAAELEMMNLTGDGNGFDMVSLPEALRARVPTANFFLRAGYERNGVARRHDVVAQLLAATDARMDREARRPGAQALAAVYPQGAGE